MKTISTILSCALVLGLSTPVRADEQTKQIQTALSEAGFYYGNADGKMGEETRAALRRFQIRNGLDVSGEASTETLAALKVSKSGEGENKIPAQPSAAEAEDEERLVQDTRPAEVAPKLVTETPMRTPTRGLFADTDLSEAPNSRQSDAILDAQAKLAALGYYRGTQDGLAGRETETALLSFQNDNRLRRTGQLDADTRRALVDAPPSVPTKPFRSKINRPPGVVLRGIWVR